MERKIAWEKYSQEEMDKVFTFAEDYRQFLSHGKTERECVKWLRQRLTATKT